MMMTQTLGTSDWFVFLLRRLGVEGKRENKDGLLTGTHLHIIARFSCWYSRVAVTNFDILLRFIQNDHPISFCSNFEK